MRNHLLWGILILVVSAVIALPIAAPSWSLFHSARTSVVSPQPSPASIPGTHGKAPIFTLTDQEDQIFSSDSLKTRVWIADFIFTSCAGTCPQMTAQMKQLQEKLPPEIQLVSITVDPVRDTPAVLKRYSQQVGADPNRWIFLTGDRSNIETLSRQGFHLGLAEGGSPEEPIIHSVRFVLVDSEGVIRGFYDGTDLKAVEKLIQQAQVLLDSQPIPSP